MAGADDHYRIEKWSDGYFKAGANGRLLACPKGSASSPDGIALHDVVDAARDQGLSLPLLVRFCEILETRVRSLTTAFSSAMERHNYGAAFHPVYPIKVNQQRSVVDTIAATGYAGFECGSKPELLAVMASQKAGGIIVCNGYKDRDYLQLGLMATKMGFRCYLVLEKLSELDLAIKLSRKSGIEPMFGLRARLSRVSRGHWQNSGGAKSKFGFSAAGLVKALSRFEKANMIGCVRLLHVHLGSQISSLDDIEKGVEEASNFYASLRHRGCSVDVLDLGGGLGINYDGMNDLGIFSINYGLDEYAEKLVGCVVNTCAQQDLPHPELFTESGRALTAHHAVLVTDVVDQEPAQLSDLPTNESETTGPVEQLHTLRAACTTGDQHARQCYEQANDLMTEVLDGFSVGAINLAQRANAEHCHQDICIALLGVLEKAPGEDHALLDELRERRALRGFLNLSIFQSLPDIWALDQVFPIVPLQRLDERPDRRAVLCDLTCDSDGRIDRYVGRSGLGNTLAVHDFDTNDGYLLGVFLVGAYQEILGDMHNLFGDTDSVDVVVDGHQGFRLTHAEPADTAAQVLAYVHFEPDVMLEKLKQKLDTATLSEDQRTHFLNSIRGLLSSSTYMSAPKEQNPGK